MTIGTLQINQSCLIPLVARLQCLAHLVRLDDFSFQPFHHLQDERGAVEVSRLFMEVFWGFCGSFFVNLLRSEYICGGFVEVFSKFVEVLCVIVEVLCLIVVVLCIFI